MVPVVTVLPAVLPCAPVPGPCYDKPSPAQEPRPEGRGRKGTHEEVVVAPPQPAEPKRRVGDVEFIRIFLSFSS